VTSRDVVRELAKNNDPSVQATKDSAADEVGNTGVRR